MSLLGKLLGISTEGILDDKAERTFAQRLGAAAIIFSSGVAVSLLIFSLRCG